MIYIEIRAAEGGDDAKLLIDILGAAYKRRAQLYG
jgi:protein subunit release factor A